LTLQREHRAQNTVNTTHAALNGPRTSCGTMDPQSSSRQLALEKQSVDLRSIGDVSATISPVNADALNDLEGARASSVYLAKPIYAFPKARVALALLLLLLGFCLAVSGMAVPSMPVGIVGAVLIIPGGYMSFVYLQVWRGDPRFRQEDWLIRVDEDAV